jgi:hypothetical protein
MGDYRADDDGETLIYIGEDVVVRVARMEKAMAKCVNTILFADILVPLQRECILCK